MDKKELQKAHSIIDALFYDDKAITQWQHTLLENVISIAQTKLHQPDVSGSVAYDKVSKLLSALNDVRNWDDDLEDEWEDQGYRAKAALAEYYKATDR